jgi:pyridoxal phosphate enzyme (YggS family)
MENDLVKKIHVRMEQVLGDISEAATRSGRDADSVHLVVVTKSQPLNLVQAVIAAGATILGENYVEEAEAKITALSESAVEWHMIGHIQRRKAALVARYFTMVHSLDSVKLAERLDRFCGESNRIIQVLLEVNVSGEESKFGFPAWNENSWLELVPLFKEILSFPHLQVRGLMTMPPFVEDPEKSRPYFMRLSRLQAFIKNHLTQTTWNELSMGTSVDYSIAIEEGSTYVRVGQAILGPRPGKKI